MYIVFVSVKKSNLKRRKYYLIEAFMSLKSLAVMFLIVISKAVCEDDKNITITNSKTMSLWRVWEECHFYPQIRTFIATSLGGTFLQNRW